MCFANLKASEKKKMVSPHKIDQANQVCIAAYLQAQGFKPINRWSQNTRFENPLREEKTPSFDVNEKKNLWFDRGTGQGGDMIKLVMQYKQCSFQAAVAELTAHTSSFSFRQPSTQVAEQQAILLKKVKPLENKALLQYLQQRAIDTAIAKEYVQEAYYCPDESSRQYFSLAFPSKAGGYELRNKYYKGCIGQKCYSLIGGADRSRLLLFEGFMDFLSYLTFHAIARPGHPSLVLNSLTLLTDELIDKMKPFEVHTYLDNDLAGEEATRKLYQRKLTVVDHSVEYEPYKDFNEFLTKI